MLPPLASHVLPRSIANCIIIRPQCESVSPQVLLRSHPNAPVVGSQRPVNRLYKVAERLHVRLARCLVTCGSAKHRGIDLSERPPKLNEADRIAVTLVRVPLAPQDGDCRCDSRTLEPFLHLRLDDRNDPKVAQEEFLKLESIFSIPTSQCW